jgi:hypothetical protein
VLLVSPVCQRRARRLVGHRSVDAVAENELVHERASDFRKPHLRALSELFVQVPQLCEKVGLVKLGHVALVQSSDRFSGTVRGV